MHVVPRPDHVYRRTDSRELIGPEGFDADPCDLDIARALRCGDLSPVKPVKPVKPAKAAKAASA